MQCSNHENCSPDQMVWLPIGEVNDDAINTNKGKIKKHPYCINCGIVKNLRADRAKNIGYYTNLLADIKRVLEFENKKTNGLIPKLTQTQTRLLMNDLSSIVDFEDQYWRNQSSQKDIFINTLKRYRPDLSSEFINTFF